MKELEILKDPNPKLRVEAEAVNSFNGAIQELIDNMIYTMRKSDGIGMAAPQVNESKKIIIAEYETPEKTKDNFPLFVIVNPKIVECSKEKEFMVEGCLSFPGKELYIKRPKESEVEGFDRWGKPIKVKTSDLFCRVLLHEIDHLNGVLMIDHIKSVKTVFIGNGSLGFPILERITDDPQFDLQAVLTSINRPSGRKNLNCESLVAEEANKLKLKLYKIDKIRDSKTIKLIKEINPELIILADFGQILSKELVQLPKYGVLNIHPSLLPKYRGPSPIVSALLAGEKRTGVSIIKLDENIDSGNILSQIEIRISSRETAVNLKKKLAGLAAELLAETVPYYLAGEITPIVQDQTKATESKIITKENGKLVGNESSQKVDRMVRALYPWPGVYIGINKRKFFITKVHLNKEKKLIIDRVKPEGKKEMSYTDFTLGNSERLTF